MHFMISLLSLSTKHTITGKSVLACPNSFSKSTFYILFNICLYKQLMFMWPENRLLLLKWVTTELLTVKSKCVPDCKEQVCA